MYPCVCIMYIYCIRDLSFASMPSLTSYTHKPNQHQHQQRHTPPITSALLPDLATLPGNDFFFPTDPLSGQSRGFEKKVTVPLQPPTLSKRYVGYDGSVVGWMA